MKLHFQIVLIFVILGTFYSVNAQYIEVNDTYTAQQLVENVLINSPCAQVSNFTINGWEYSNGEKSYGYFNRGTSTFPFQEGVLITTGRAVSAIGPNDSLLSEGPVEWGGDPDLEAAIGEFNTINATVLEFDFLPIANKMSFEYIFSSEQYLSNPNPNQCFFSDGFAFLLCEVNPQTQYANLALVPGTNIPVKVTTVRGSGTICQPANTQYFDAFNGIEHPTNYNGQTVILKAEATVTPGVLYHLKLVVADQGNRLYDSGIFLGGGSFKVEIDLGPDRTVANQNPVCEGEIYTLDASQPGNNSYQWFLNNNLIPGATQATYDVTEAGEYSVVVLLENTSCEANGSVLVEYVGAPADQSVTLVACDTNGDGQAVFNLSSLNPLLNNNDSSLTITYYSQLSDALNQTNPIAQPQSYAAAPSTIYGVVSTNFGCGNLVTISLELSNNSLNLDPLPTFCDDFANETDGIRIFNFANEITPLIVNQIGPGFTIEYFANNTLSDVLPNSYQNTTAFQQLIYVKISQGLDCIDVIPLLLDVFAFQQESETTTIGFCEGNPVTLTAPSFNGTYLWSTGETSQIITVTVSGTYEVELTSVEGCSQTQTFEVIAGITPQSAVVNVIDFNGNQNTIEVLVTPPGDYQYSLDGFIFQSSNLFLGVLPGDYTITIRSVCGELTENAMVLDYPRFLTPNGDGYNDTWRIDGLNQPNATVSIFNRYGQLLKVLQPSGSGWDGMRLGRPLPSDDYWFILKLEDGREVRGHFALKR